MGLGWTGVPGSEPVSDRDPGSGASSAGQAFGFGRTVPRSAGLPVVARVQGSTMNDRRDACPTEARDGGRMW